VIPDGTTPPPDSANTYIQSAYPGGCAPHLWLGESESLFDRFGFEWTLLHFAGDDTGARAFRTEAARRGVPLKVVRLELPEARELYESDLVLVRPDQIVAWRGAADMDPGPVLDRLACSD
jgi:hypothetical protein